MLAEPALPLPEAELYIWDYRPGLDLARELAAGQPQSHLLLVERKDLEAFGSGSFAGVMVVLKPVTKAALAAWLLQAVPGRGAVRLRRDRDEILQWLLEANLRLQEYDLDRTNFLAKATHDFRAPLTASSGYCGLLLDGQLGPLADAQKDVIRRVHASLKRLARMTTAMFELSVGQRIRRIQKLEEADIREPIEQALHEIRQAALERRIRLEVDLAPPSETMRFERAQLEQVVLNLFDNACKFTPKAGQIEVRGCPCFWDRRSTNFQSAVRTERRVHEDGAPNAYRVDVGNSGAAIPPERLGQIFEEYASYGEEQGCSGSGLGLAICKAIVQQHCGRIWAENSPKGPVFSFVLPFQPEIGGSIPERGERVLYQTKGAVL
jgi:signal transduction histidine kinase